ncbi:hypothetical protein N7522_005990 [Penicillium canescens]|uniref:Folliculin-interacting protein N-terminal domain-containing protein n=1 Tax=Penicillium canescens TaxID=5083 RepID=A0AAD6IGU2_PENCN|nr:uncharacterized protein N7446_011386 [Penicillium canescens]KAJ6004345.1 hypothetical protein N7522_005990 [Penicillium canescens]KAJ6047698.1 hypothetical protein N7460_003845 [Penicillium canescens]KAJ6048703.1 hypothetical protein N7446_011386 [Penicillium canescens]KAJ6173245.1 hypothetical protein N7485_006057 [Penicillium canescens]
MLGRLLSTAASTLNPAAYSTRNNGTPLESVTEEEHTSGLLFPDASLLRRSNTHAYPLQTTFNSPNASTAGAYDDRGGMELDPIKDFRVIVAQNALGDRDACVLLDTRASDSPTGLGIDPQGNDQSGPRHTRAVSSLSRGTRRNILNQSSVVESSPLSVAADARRSSPASAGAFSRARGRSSTLAPSATLHETGHSRHSADSNDTGLLNCIFGSSAFSYRGSSTKMHIISADDDTGPGTNASSPASRSPLSRAYTTGSPSGLMGAGRGVDSKPPSKVTVLLTRMFSVNLPEGAEASAERHDYASALYQESLPEMGGFPFPDVSKRKKIKEKKTPMYAVAITIQIPLLARNPGRPVSRFSTLGPDSPRPGFSSSLDSDHRWPGGFFDDSLSAASPPASLDERLDLLVDHWDVITRTLSHLERLARNEILFLLKKVDSLLGPHPKPAKPPNMQRTNQTIVHLPANILSVNSKLKEEAIRSSRRISLALQTPYVVTGQSRWGVWREEGRSIVRGLGDKEQNFFFLVILTAFLGNHTEWLNTLGPEWYRRRHNLQQKSQQDGEPILANRTVIVCPDKMTARRLVFLLAAFLPSKQRLEPLPSPLRPGTSISMRAISHSPPTVPVLRQESLRRAIERRARANRLNMGENDYHRRSVSVSSQDTAQRSSDGADITPPAEPSTASARRGSDARSIRTLGVKNPPKDRAKNTSGATTSMITQSSTVPVPHFTSQPSSSHQTAAAEGNDSLASETLLKNLQRSDSSVLTPNGSFPSAGGRWGGIFSGLWSSRQESSAESSEPYSPTDTRKRSVSTIVGPAVRGPTTLSQMVKEVTEVEDEQRRKNAPSGNISIPAAAAHSDEAGSPEPSSLTSQVRESPLKMSVRAEEGVVDVDLPLPGFMSLSSSGDSTVASPKKTRTSVTSMDAIASTHSSGSGFHGVGKDNDGPTAHVAGWLKSFHEDFSLQAVRPYASLETEIKQAMRAEPSPYIPSASDVDGSERWVDVATTLIADTRASTVKRIRLRRKVTVGHDSPTHTPASPANGLHLGGARHTGGSRSSQFSGFFNGPDKIPESSTAEEQDQSFVEERFIEEPVMDLDGVLVDAVERVLGQSGNSSLAHSRAPSPTRARKAEDNKAPPPRTDEAPPLEVPRGECRKMVLGALEEVVRIVTAEHCREDVDSTLALADRERRRALAGADNTLREGIRKWLLDVEEAW